eukprot:1800141-Prymnesium_polylepis.1
MGRGDPPALQPLDMRLLKHSITRSALTQGRAQPPAACHPLRKVAEVALEKCPSSRALNRDVLADH